MFDKAKYTLFWSACWVKNMFAMINRKERYSQPTRCLSSNSKFASAPCTVKAEKSTMPLGT